MIAAHEGIPSPVSEPSWIPYWQRVVVDTIARLQPITGEAGKELEGYPDEWDLWLFKKVASWLLGMKELSARQLWEPILALGPAAHIWVDRFLKEWVMVMFNYPDNAEGRRIWLQMAGFALLSPTWNTKDGIHYFHRHELWRSLLGLDWPNSWGPEQKGLAEELRPALKSWAFWSNHDPRNIRALAIFLASEAANRMRVEGLIWLEPAGKAAQINGHRWEDAADSLSCLLSIIWEEDQLELRGNPTAFQTFQLLLAGLVARQHPLGLELNVRVGGSNNK
jgi:hypothetical protein